MISGQRRFFRYLGAAAVVVVADYLLVLTDCVIAGRVIGEMALGAMNLMMPVFSVMMFFTWLLASGTSTLYLRSVRKRDEARAAAIAGRGLVAACLMAVVLCLLQWALARPYIAFMDPGCQVATYVARYWRWYPAVLALQSVCMMMLYLAFVRGGERVCIKAYAVQLAANIAVSYALATRWGLEGVAIGKVVSFLVWLAAFFVFLRQEGVGLKFARARFDPSIFLQAARASSGESFVWLFHAVLFFGITKYVLYFWDAESLAVCAVVFFIIHLTVFFNGVGVAMRPLESGRGAEVPSDVARVFRIGTSAAFAAMVLAAVVFFIAPEPVIGLFGIESDDLVIGSKFAARVTVAGLVVGGLVAVLPLLRRVRSSSVAEARLNYLQTYVLGRLADGSGAQMFNLAKLFRLREGIDLERLSAALVSAGEAHGALHTVLRKAADGEIVQRRELADGSVRCPVVRMSEAELMARKSELVKEFDVRGGVLFDATIFDCGGGRAYLLSNFHHLICDGYSFPLILADAHRVWNGETLEPDSYYEVLARREERAAAPLAVAGRNFMREILKDREFTTLPRADFDGKPGYGTLELELGLPDSFEEVLSARRVTRHHVFLAATAIALRRITGAANVLLDWVFHGRVTKDELRTVGAFMVDLPLIFDGTEDLSAAEVCALVKRATYNGIKGVSFFRTVADCNPTGQERLTFIYQDEWGELMSPGPVREDGPYAWMIEETIPLAAPQAATENPFNVEIMEHRDATRLFIEYDTGLYSEATVRRYADCFKESLDWLLTT